MRRPCIANAPQMHCPCTLPTQCPRTAGEALPTLTFWLDAVRKQADACAAQLRATPAGTAKAEAAQRRAEEPWAEHADRREVRPVGVPVVVLGHKWNDFEANYGECYGASRCDPRPQLSAS